jgi:hypothetical protein
MRYFDQSKTKPLAKFLTLLILVLFSTNMLYADVVKEKWEEFDWESLSEEDILSGNFDPENFPNIFQVLELEIKSGVTRMKDPDELVITDPDLESLFMFYGVNGLVAKYPDANEDNSNNAIEYPGDNPSTVYRIHIENKNDIIPIIWTLNENENIGSVEFVLPTIPIPMSSGISEIRPNDFCWHDQWYFMTGVPRSIDIERTWHLTTGTEDVVLGHIDWRIRSSDLSEFNDEIPASRIVTGSYLTPCHILNEDNDNDNDLDRVAETGWADTYHGVSTLSVMAANGNNDHGIAGINWNSPIYHVKMEWDLRWGAGLDWWNWNNLVDLWDWGGTNGRAQTMINNIVTYNERNPNSQKNFVINASVAIPNDETKGVTKMAYFNNG